MHIREYSSEDCKELYTMFYNTIHSVNSKDYTKLQLNAWADGKVNLVEWNKSFLKNYAIVAIINDVIVGFGDINNCGYLDRLYVHKDYQNRGIATEICNILELKFPVKTIQTHASITAKPFFEKRGYITIKENQVIRKDVTLTNYLMEKTI